jgi:hypothetical protein
MNKRPPIRIMESDNPSAADINACLTQDGYFTTALIFKGPKAREFSRKLGILK